MTPLVDFAKLRIPTVVAPSGELLLLHSDACRAIGIRNTTSTLDRLLPDERMTAREALGPTYNDKWLITVDGFWRLALSTKTKAAETLKTWLCGQVLPALTTEGRYEVPKDLPLRSDMETRASMARVSAALAKTLRKLDGLTIKRAV